jgi:hypothetical protein
MSRPRVCFQVWLETCKNVDVAGCLHPQDSRVQVVRYRHYAAEQCVSFFIRSLHFLHKINATKARDKYSRVLCTL